MAEHRLATEVDGSGPTAPMLPLGGIRVLDLTRILSGPYCSLLLAELGADVVKVERSDRGDDTRAWGPPFLDDEHRISTYFGALNRGKRSLALDFRAPGALDLLRRLCARADVVIENFRPDTAESLGLEWRRLRELNPSLILCSISGFGRNGPYSDIPATEIVVEGLSGLMEITGPVDGEPVRFGIAMVDIATGLTAATKIASALLVAQRSGIGTHIECSLYGAALAALATPVAAYTATGEEPRRWGSHHPSIVPYGGFPTADGHLITGIINDAMWPAFCAALELDDLLDDKRLHTNAGRVACRAEVQAVVAAQCASKPTDYWIDRLRSRGLLAAPIRTVGAAIADPATNGMGLLVPFENFPGVMSTRLDCGVGTAQSRHVPLLGEHTSEILGDHLELTAQEIQQLFADGVVGTSLETAVTS